MSENQDDPLAGIDLSQYGLGKSAPATTPPAGQSDDPLAGIDLSQYGLGKPAAPPPTGTAQLPASTSAVAGESASEPAPKPWSELPGNAWSGVKKAGADFAQGVREGQAPTLGRLLSGAVSGVGSLAKAGDSKVNSLLGLDASSPINKAMGYVPPTGADKAAVEAPLDTLIQNKENEYGSLTRARNTLITQPWSTLMDAATVADPALSGLGAVKTTLGFGAEAASGLSAAEVAANAARIANPKIDAAIKTYTDGRLSAADIPADAHPAFLKTIDEKGLSPATAGEALASASGGVPVPKHVFTGEAPPSDVAQGVGQNIAAANDTIGKKLSDVSGADAPHPSDLAQAVEQKYLDSVNNNKKLYSDAFSEPGDFAPGIIDKHVMPAVDNSLSTMHDFPMDPRELAASPRFPQAKAALQFIRDNASQMDPKNLPAMERFRRDVSSFSADAKSSDKMAVSKIVAGIDDGIINAAKTAGDFSGNGAAAAQKMTTAREAFKAHDAAFNSAADPVSSKIAASIENLRSGHSIDDATGQIIPASQPAAQAAQHGLASALLHKAYGPSMYEKLSGILGPEGAAPLNDFVKQSTMQKGVKASDTAKFQGLLNSPLAQKAFTPEELSAAKFHNEARRIYNKAPIKGVGASESLTGSAGKAIARTLAAGAGHALYGIPGALASVFMEGKGESMLHNRALNKALSGAPKSNRIQRGLASGLRAAASPVTNQNSRMAAEATRLGAQTQQPLPQRAAGGAVGGHQHLVDRLLSAVEHAKKQERESTKSILHMPDEAVASALNKAQEAI
jgi:hypothetical protein